MLFFLMAADEASEFHEMMIRPMRELLKSAATGLLYWTWILPMGALALAVVIASLRFVSVYLPRAMRNACVLGAALFIGGAIGVEMPEARHFQLHGGGNMTYASFVLVEEVMEKAGILAFLRGLLIHIETQVSPLRLIAGRKHATTDD